MGETTALDRAKAAVAACEGRPYRARMEAAGVTDSRALDIAGQADFAISCLRTQLQAKGVELAIARKVAARRNGP